MIKSLKCIFILVLFASASIIYYGCACNCGSTPEADIPSEVLKNANEIIIAKTGKEFFDKYISIDLQRSKELPPDYFLVYRMIIPDKPYVNERIELTVDANGNLNKNFLITGLPDCANGECEFSIDNQKAVSIAGESGLDKGIKDWESTFTWSDKFNKYVWHVLATMQEDSLEDVSSGKEVIIDSNTGNVLEKNDWKVD